MKNKIISLLIITIFFQFQIYTVYGYETYKIGDKIQYNGSDYYVMKNSGEKSSYLKLLKAEPLKYNEIEDKYFEEVSDDLLYLPFSSDTLHCSNTGNNSSCTMNYDETNIKSYINTWVNNKIGNNNLVEVDGYQARLINLEDLANLDYNSEESGCLSSIKYCRYGDKDNNIFKKYDTKCDYNECHYYYIFDTYLQNNTIASKTYNSCLTSTVINSNQQEAVNNLAQNSIGFHCDLNLCDATTGEQVGKVSDFLNFEEHSICTQPVDDKLVLKTNNEYDWINYNNMSFWTMVSHQTPSYMAGQSYVVSKEYLYYYKGGYSEFDSSYESYPKLTIRPVVNFKKSALGGNKNYSIGDKITFNENDYYVIEDSNSSKDYVTALKYKPLMESDVGKEKSKDDYAKVAFSESNSGCNSTTNITNCDANFEVSNVKKILTSWANNYLKDEDLITKNNYKYRLITLDELLNDFGYEIKQASTINIQATENTPSWIYDPSIFYWAMPEKDESEIGTAGYGGYSPKRVTEFVLDTFLLDKGQIRPVINLSKCALGDEQCETCPSGIAKYQYIEKIKKYDVGDKVTYEGEDYYVIKTSDENSKVLTLLKEHPLSLEELNNYVQNQNNPYASPNEEGIEFFRSNECKEIDYDTGSFPYNCNHSYEKSIAKKVVDYWSSNKIKDSDLVEIDNYKVRLLTKDELIDDLHYELKDYFNGSINSDQYQKTENTYDWAYIEGEPYWIMDSFDLVNEMKNYVKNIIGEQAVYKHSNIRPVININKCAIEGACTEEIVIASCDDPKEYNSTIVDVPATLSKISILIIIISVSLIVIGISIIVYNYKKHGKVKK